MRAQFIVTIEGSWLYNGQPATHAKVEKELREAAKEKFEFLADRVTVRRHTEAATAAQAQDAERYRWLREHWFMFGTMHSLSTTLGVNLHRVVKAADVETLDAAIDAAMPDAAVSQQEAQMRHVPDAECAQGKCALPTTGCWGRCELAAKTQTHAKTTAYIVTRPDGSVAAMVYDKKQAEEIVAGLDAALHKQPALISWQPIVSAPRDGQNILLRFGQDGVSQGKYVPGLPHPWKFLDTNDGITWLINHAVDGPGGPSHWMPIPDDAPISKGTKHVS